MPGRRPRRIPAATGHRLAPAVLASALAAGRVAAGERVAITARDGLRVEGRLAPGGGDRQARWPARPDDRLPPRRPDRQAYRPSQPFRLLLAREGYAFLDVDFRGSTGYGRDFRRANHDEWGHADVHDLIDAAAGR